MELSVVIVNYNVKHFLEQCLHAVFGALRNIEAEVFVVDNNSLDGSAAMVRDKFQEVKFIQNEKNVGFAKANNQAIKQSKGKYVLLLNPDTVVEENTFNKVLQFMNAHPKAGGLGVKMIDGKGNFLPESKRSLPTPWVSFFKIFGLSNLFPKSKLFSKYHLGNLPKDELNQVEVLAGAFMLLRKSVLNEVGLLDEDFFMYGEDIDLSYRILQAGYVNYYYPHTTIIHYKGESTKKGSLNYVKLFYKAMIIYANKHFSKKNAFVYQTIIQVAIYLRALFAIVYRAIAKVALPFIDAVILFTGFWVVAPIWGAYRFDDPNYYEPNYFMYAVPAFITVWLLSIFYQGGYDKPINLLSILKGLALGTVLILLIYALLPEELRFSRALILFGAIWGSLGVLSLRFLLHALKIPSFKLSLGRKIKYAVVGSVQESERIQGLLNELTHEHNFVGRIWVKAEDSDRNSLGEVHQLSDIVSINRVDEVIFSAVDLSSTIIIKYMLELAKQKVSMKIAPPESMAIIGSNSIDTAGDFYALDFNMLIKPANLRRKRLFDIVSTLVFIIFLPLLLLIIPQFIGFLRNVFFVLFGIKSWVGIYPVARGVGSKLHSLKQGVISWVLVYNKQSEGADAIERYNLMYAKDYHVSHDLRLMIKGYKHLGKT